MASTKMVVAVKSIIFTLGFLLGASASNSSDLDCEAKIPVVDGKWQCPDGTVVPFRPVSLYYIPQVREGSDNTTSTELQCIVRRLAAENFLSFGVGNLITPNDCTHHCALDIQQMLSNEFINYVHDGRPVDGERSTKLILHVSLDDSLPDQSIGNVGITKYTPRLFMVADFSLMQERPLKTPNREEMELKLNEQHNTPPDSVGWAYLFDGGYTGEVYNGDNSILRWHISMAFIDGRIEVNDLLRVIHFLLCSGTAEDTPEERVGDTPPDNKDTDDFLNEEENSDSGSVGDNGDKTIQRQNTSRDRFRSRRNFILKKAPQVLAITWCVGAVLFCTIATVVHWSKKAPNNTDIELHSAEGEDLHLSCDSSVGVPSDPPWSVCNEPEDRRGPRSMFRSLSELSGPRSTCRAM